MVLQKEQIKDFFMSLDEIKELVKGKEPIFFLDYDGTLTPIVDTPDLAILSSEMKTVVEKLSHKYKVSIVSGRATDDVHQKVDIKNLFYAGSHGFEIIDPTNNVTINKEAKEVRNVIKQAYEELSQCLEDVDGALVEDVKYTISAHYRLVADNDLSKVKEAVEAITKKYPLLCITYGKKVFEIRPRIDWDKGKAVDFILSTLMFDAQKQVAIYIGDDTTDEDAFRILKGKGFGVLVSEEERASNAQYKVKTTNDVQKVLEYFL
ncbi:MAG: trehalose-phosphatase [Lysobacterales bacterium]|jgi:trehalose-phosphatase